MRKLAPGMRIMGSLLRKLGGPSIASLDDAALSRAAARTRGGVFMHLTAGWPRPGVHLRERSVPGRSGPIPVRVYTPARADSLPRPLVLMMHGGGFVFGGLDMADWIASRIAHGLDGVVVSVDYRLAPTHRFPAAVEDCRDALCWAAANAASLGASPHRIGVMGESAGGNLAAVMTLMARDEGGPAIRHQTLIYPATDLMGALDRPGTRDPVLSVADMRRFRSAYLGPDAATADTATPDWRHSPLRAASHRDLPPALVLVAGHDPLREDGLRYAGMLREAGVQVALRDYPDMPHGFLNLPRFNLQARPALRRIIQAQRLAL